MHVRLSAGALLFTLGAAFAAAALPYRVDLAAGSVAVHPAKLHARRIDAPAPELVLEIALPASGVIDVAEGTWELALESEEVWAPPVYVRASDEATLSAVPAGRLRAKLARLAEIAMVTVALTPADSKDTQRAEVACPVADEKILCTVPAGTWDVRVTPRGFVPQFFWNVAVPSGVTSTIGDVKLVEGAAVIGRVTRADGGALPENARVTLIPSGAGPEEARALAQTVPVNPKGFFAVQPVLPGNYFITALAKTLASDSREITVIANRTAELNAPLVLDTLKTVHGFLEPRLGPGGGRWAVRIALKRLGSDNAYDEISTSTANTEGEFTQKLRDGDYVVSVGDDESQWGSQEFRIAGEDVEVRVALPFVKASGTIVYGDQPINAHLYFGGESGTVRRLVQTADDGTFTALIPVRDQWDIFVEADAPPIRRTLRDVEPARNDDGSLTFDLRLPTTTVLGTAVRADGTPAAGAAIDVDGMKRLEYDQIFAADDGTFVISGLPPGSYRATALLFRMESEVVQFEVSEETATPLRLVLRETSQLSGRVTAGGVPVIGASITAVPRNTRSMTNATAITNESGSFGLLLPPDATLVDMIVAPPGFAAIMARVPVRTDKLMQIGVDTHGGTLVVEAPANLALTVFHGGAELSLLQLARETSGAIEEETGRYRVTIPLLEAGDYRICLMDTCDSGYLPPHGLLRLKLSR